MLPYFLSKISGYLQNIWAKSYDSLDSLLCSVMLAYENEQNLMCALLMIGYAGIICE